MFFLGVWILVICNTLVIRPFWVKGIQALCIVLKKVYQKSKQNGCIQVDLRGRAQGSESVFQRRATEADLPSLRIQAWELEAGDEAHRQGKMRVNSHL